MAAVFHKVVRELSSLRYPLAATRIALRGLCALASCFYLRQRPDFLRQYRIILSADTASEVRQMLSQKRR